MKRLTKILAGVALLTLIGCAPTWQKRSQNAANAVHAHPDLELCLFNLGIEPTSFENCVRASDDMNGARACIPEDKRVAAERCWLDARVSEQNRTHHLNCAGNAYAAGCVSN